VDKSKTSLVVDVGGGSTELIVGKGEKIFFSKSLNIGGVRLTEKYITTQPVIPEERLKMCENIRAQIQPTLAQIQEHRIEQIVAVAGTPTSIVAIEVGGFSEEKVEGFFLTKDRLAFWVDEFAKTSIEDKRKKYELGGRADIIFAGASVLLELLTLLGQPGLNVSTKGVRYGVALEMLQKQ
jgi:exopolyphosphatase/guanosine-5'-triphosphate,3'-diphosphate pyrophosphatase